MLFSLVIAVVPLILVSVFSYVKATDIIEDKVSLSNFNTVQQIADNIDQVFKDMKNSSYYLWQNKEFMNYMRMSADQISRSPNALLQGAVNSVNNFVVFRTNIYSIYVEAANGLTFDTASATNVISPNMKRRLLELRGEGLLMADTVTNYDNTETKVISFLKVFKDIDNLSSDLAFIKINILEDEISNIYRNKPLSNNVDTFVIDEQRNVISSLNASLLGDKLNEKYDDRRIYEDTNGYFQAKIDGQPYIETRYNLSRPGWRLVNLVPLNELSRDAHSIRNFTIVVLCIISAICIAMIVLFTYRVLGPLNRIRKAMKELEHENFKVNLSVTGNDEIALIGRSFNRMSHKLGELIHEVYAVQIKQKEAELKALHAQINPHFLYNTLDTIYWMCRIEKAHESSNLVQALSKLFRLSLNSGNEFTTVKSEIEHLNHYIFIQEKRFEDRIRFTIRVSDDVLNGRVAKLILQPIVENAIQHGIEKKGENGRIDVDIFAEGGTLIYQITDDGAGADENEINRLLFRVEEDNRGFGIKNVNDRIQLYFGSEYGLHFTSAPGAGTTVIIKQPFVQGGSL
ncbi:sensor histidine kinase [Cohnella yongneupensis]|uniref:histidine kinase n=1 Tax=Cohnella yongneupensis TaxID=425006 RepID=A0ABW0QXV1_9BACL